jgi:trehalose 6-phosphate synthase/phosphatase
MARLIIVSNRLPLTLQVDGESFNLKASSGGLVSALGAYLDRRRGEDPTFQYVWLGWPGASVPREMEAAVQTALAGHNAHAVFLSKEDMDKFYHGFCNSTLWPLFHYFPSYAEYDPAHWDTYQAINERFARAVSEIMRQGDTIWIHDYQLLLLPRMVRSGGVAGGIGLFLHIPFPSYELLRLLPTPWKREILLGMLGADLIGFHVHEYTQYFLQAVFRALGHDHNLGQIAIGDEVRRADTFPIGIDFDKFMGAAQSPAVASRQAEIELGIRDRKAIFSVDRLDYTKGILNRLTGYEHFLTRYPEWHQKVVFLLNVVPSRGEVAQYERMKQELDKRVGEINGRLGTMDWVPIVYQYRALDFATLVALYKMCPVALITPLRDGMNLVAKEFIASKPDAAGVLILSEMAGVAREMSEAVLVNPNHFSEIADALAQALSMPPEEQVRRNRPMQERLKAYDATRWANHFLSSLARIKSQQGELAVKHLTPTLAAQMYRRHAEATRPLLLLDYDGTLVPLAAQPHLAAPDLTLLALLDALTKTRNNTVFVISGRDRRTLDQWLGRLDIGMVAEHGAWIKRPREDWQLLKPLASEWKLRIAPILRMYVDQVAGSLLEEKDFSLAWHYRGCDPELGVQRAKELIHDVTQFTANLNIQVIEGKKVVEIRNAGISKGDAGADLVHQLEPDFVLAVGDDQTDEDLFRMLPRPAYTIRVGAPYSVARYSLNDPSDVRAILTGLLG